MKICVVNNIYPPYDRGGAEQVVVKTVEGLVARGHEVVIITSTPKEEVIEHVGRVTIYRLHPQNLFFYTDANRHNPLARLLWHGIDIFHLPIRAKVRRILQHESPDVVHTHNLMGLSFLLPGLIRRLRIRHVHTVHDVQLVEPSAMIIKTEEHSWRYRGLHTKIYSALMRMLIGSPTVVISPSQFLLDFYLARRFFRHSTCVVVRNPVTFQPQALRHFDQRFAFHFLYVGQIESHKGVELLVEAFTSLMSDIPTGSAMLHIVGNGSLLDSIKETVGDTHMIKVYGRVERSDLPALFSLANMTVVPSLCYENSPTVIFESFACGVPVIASNIEGIAELIREGDNGLTFEAGNVAALKAKMRWAYDHQPLVRAMGERTGQSLLGLGLTEYIGKLESLFQPKNEKTS